MTEDHEKWLKNFNKRKEGKMFNLLYELKEDRANFKVTACSSKATHLAAALMIAVKGTKMEKDAKEIIKICAPQYFERRQQKTK